MSDIFNINVNACYTLVDTTYFPRIYPLSTQFVCLFIWGFFFIICLFGFLHHTSLLNDTYFYSQFYNTPCRTVSVKYNSWPLKYAVFISGQSHGSSMYFSLWFFANRAGSRTHEQLSSDLPLELSGDLPTVCGSIYQPSSCRGRLEPS